MSTISERLGISNEIRELKFGKSFTNTSNNSKYNSNKNSFNDNGPTESFHTIRYDFKPVSVDTNQTATIEFNEKNKITVTAPNVEGSGMSCTVFQGSRKPHLKECVLVFDHETGDFTLERLTNNIVVKKTRAEGSSKIVNQQRPITPAGLNQKSVSPKLNNQMNGSTIATKSPNSTTTANGLNGSHRSPKEKLNQQQQSNAQPMNSMPIFNSNTLTVPNLSSTVNGLTKNTFNDNEVGVLSSSSSSSSSSEDDSSSSSSASSSSEDEDEENTNQKRSINTNSNAVNNIPNKQMNMNMSASSSDSEDDEKLSSLNNNLINSLNNGLSNVGISNGPIGFSMPKLSDLNDDLQLSESGSDSD